MFIKNLLYVLGFVALDGEGEGEGTSPEGTTQEPVTEPESTNQEPTEPEIPKYEIDGEEVDLNTIKEWRQGHLRQSDYTKKTTEVAKMRKEIESMRQQNQDALEIYQFLQSNPHLAQELYEKSNETGQDVPKPTQRPTTDPRVDQVVYELELQKVEAKLSEITKNDPDVNDVELLNLANERNIDLDTAYTLWRGQNVDKLLKKEKERLAQTLKKNRESTSTLINPSDKGVTKGLGLTETEVAMAKRLEMSTEDYAKWKNYNPNR